MGSWGLSLRERQRGGGRAGGILEQLTIAAQTAKANHIDFGIPSTYPWSETDRMTEWMHIAVLI